MQPHRKTAASRRRAIHESPLRVGAAWIERKPEGNAVPGVPGDRKGRPYAIRTHRRGGALTRPPADGNGKTAPVGRVGRRGRRPLRSSELFVGIRRGRPPGRPADAQGIGKKKDQPKITTSLRGAKRRGNPHLSGPAGAGRRVAPQGLRIATPLRARNDGDNRWLVLLF